MAVASTIETTTGDYRGTRVRGVSSYLGMRYGQAPVGSGRFLPAEPAVAHSGVEDAVSYGPASVQLDGRLSHSDLGNEVFSLFFPPSGSAIEFGGTSEDCLTVNVWTPDERGPGRLPVFFWVHGGVFRSGSGSSIITAGENLARTGRAVVVSINHRLGILGFSALGHLLGERYAGSGSAGLSDIVLALQWVRDNIGHFGGDSGNVTVVGQSGGGAKVLALLRMPAARGLFAKCVAQSPGGLLLSADEGIEQTERVLRAMSIAPADADRLLDVPVSAFLRAQARIDTPGYAPSPVIDGNVLSEAEQEFAVGMPLLIGTTAHEYSLFLAGEPWYRALDDDALGGAMASCSPGRGGEPATEYRRRFPGEAAPLLLARYMSEQTFGRAAAEVAERRSVSSPVYRYEFDRTTDALGGVLGAPHCAEIPYVFDTLSTTELAGTDPERFSVGADVREAWLSFAERGVPALPGGHEWPQFAPGADTTVSIDSSWGLRTSPLSADLGEGRAL